MGIKKGNVVQAKSASFVQNATTNLFTLPGNSQIIDVQFFLPAAISSGQSRLGILGGATDDLVADTSTAAAGIIRPTTTVNVSNTHLRKSSPITVTATENAAGAGSAVIIATVFYI